MFVPVRRSRGQSEDASTRGEKGERVPLMLRHPKRTLLVGVIVVALLSIFGFSLEATWSRIIRIPMYSPVFLRDYRNPPVRSQAWRNLYLTGIIRTHPSVASTGCALGSGVETGQAICKDLGRKTDLLSTMNAFRLKRLPRA